MQINIRRYSLGRKNSKVVIPVGWFNQKLIDWFYSSTLRLNKCELTSIFRFWVIVSKHSQVNQFKPHFPDSAELQTVIFYQNPKFVRLSFITKRVNKKIGSWYHQLTNDELVVCSNNNHESSWRYFTESKYEFRANTY